MVRRYEKFELKSIYFLQFQSDSDGTSSYDEEENLVIIPRRASIAQHSTSEKFKIEKWKIISWNRVGLSNMRLGRESLPHPALDIRNVGLWQILGRSIGKDLSRVTMPVILNEPLGILQRLCEEMEYSELLDRASQIDDEHLRLVYVSAFIVSTYSANYYRTGRKNFNPIQGETYEFIPKDKNWKFFSEQVCFRVRSRLFSFNYFFDRSVIIQQSAFVIVNRLIFNFHKVRFTSFFLSFKIIFVRH